MLVYFYVSFMRLTEQILVSILLKGFNRFNMNIFLLGSDYKSDKPFSEETKAPADLSDDSSTCLKSKNKRPTLMGNWKNTWRAQTHHFQK